MKKKDKKKLLKAVRLVAENIDVIEKVIFAVTPTKPVVSTDAQEKDLAILKQHLKNVKKQEESVAKPEPKKFKGVVKPKVENHINRWSSRKPSKKKEDYADIEDYYKAVINEVVGGDRMKESMYRASKIVRDDWKAEKEQLELYNKMELLDGIISLFEKYLDKQVDLTAKIRKKDKGVSFADEIAIKSMIHDNVRVKHAE